MGSRRKSRVKRNSVGQIEDKTFYDVEKIVDVNWSELKGFVFFVKWENYASKYNTWEPLSNLTDNEVLQDFLNQRACVFEDEMEIFKYLTLQECGAEITRLESQKKSITMDEIESFDPFEFKLYQVFYHLLPEDQSYTKILKRLVLHNYFFKKDQRQSEKYRQFIATIRKKDQISLHIENLEDFDDPPVFEYITQTIISDAVAEKTKRAHETSSVVGCLCNTCTESSGCCAKINRSEFPYKKANDGSTILRHIDRIKIFECGDQCKCKIDCMNRLTQQKTKVSICLFKTPDRGWGVKAHEPIPKNTFIFHYTGEMIDQAEAENRELTRYFFDLSDDNSLFTIDAAAKGNLSRFVNHACEPNCSIWHVFECHEDPKKQKLW